MDPTTLEVDEATGLIKAPGWTMVAAQCSACHSTRLVTQNGGDEAHWKGLIRWMQKTQNLWEIPAPIEGQIIRYLAEHYPAKKASRRPALDEELLPPPAPRPAEDPTVTAALSAFQELGTTLRTTLRGAMQAQGPAAAVDACHASAPALAAAAGGEAVEVGRVSHRPRVPSHDVEPWMGPLYRALQRDPSLPYLTAELDDGRVGVLKPIPTGAVCLRCHGTAIDEDVRKTIAARYPDDRATGFVEGELRGAFFAVVTPR